MPENRKRKRRELAFHPDVFGKPAPFRVLHSPDVPAERADDEPDATEQPGEKQDHRSAPEK